MDEIIKEFLIESGENLDRLDQSFIELEKNPTDKELLSSIFRAVHTVKGNCGFLGFQKLEKVAHAGENLLSKLRDGVLALNPEITTALLTLVDVIRKMLICIESTENDGENSYAELVETLTSLCTGKSVENKAAEVIVPEKIEEKVVEAVTPTLVNEPETATQQIADSNASQSSKSANTDNSDKDKADKKSTGVTDTSIRVDVMLLDKLMNLVGELVLSRNQILQFTTQHSDTTFLATSQRLNLITTELQESVMKTRMQPIFNIWNKFPRVVRDLALGLGKKIEVLMEGKETEIDKSIIENIKDPLTHLVRNTVDHGIESPEVRLKNGKPEVGTLILKAYHEGGMVIIEITDDGGGIDLERVKAKALDRGLFTNDQLSRMKENELVNLIFLPGFSTAAKITNVSGRGVGMDVVKTNIEKIGGMLDIKTTLGQGTSIKIKIPLTLAIIPAIIITSDGDRYAIPQVSLVELVLIEETEDSKGIELIHDVPVYRLRGNLLPLVYLNQLLGTSKPSNDLPAIGKQTNIVVLQASDRQFGLVVDEINDTQEIVVKPLNKLLKGVSVFAGATIMGDGNVALILDTFGLAQQAHVISETYENISADKDSENNDNANEKHTLLLFKAAQDNLFAAPLDLVSRLEEFNISQIESSGSREVVQYRNEIMPLIRLTDLFGIPETYAEGSPHSNRVQVLVYAQQSHHVGVIVQNIIDIIEDASVVQTDLSRNGVIGSAIIQKRITEIVDLESIIKSAYPEYFLINESSQLSGQVH